MVAKKVWVVEEVEIGDGVEMGQRQSIMVYIDDYETGQWQWKRPDERLESPEAKAEWNRVLQALSNVKGEDLRHVVCAAGLMDHCLNTNNIRDYGP